MMTGLRSLLADETLSIANQSQLNWLGLSILELEVGSTEDYT